MDWYSEVFSFDCCVRRNGFGSQVLNERGLSISDRNRYVCEAYRGIARPPLLGFDSMTFLIW